MAKDVDRRGDCNSLSRIAEVQELGVCVGELTLERRPVDLKSDLLRGLGGASLDEWDRHESCTVGGDGVEEGRIDRRADHYAIALRVARGAHRVVKAADEPR